MSKIKQTNKNQKKTISAAKKLSKSTNASRGKLLKKELAKYKLVKRKDSKLCTAFIKGTTSKTAEEVAIIMCRMKYLYEGYCEEFNDEISSTEEEIDKEVENLAEDEKKYACADNPWSYNNGGYYRGIRADACREVTGTSSFGAYTSTVATCWTTFPEK